jgi:hypothetical protein
MLDTKADAKATKTDGKTSKKDEKASKTGNDLASHENR